jgi:molecular chaperone DnaK
VLQGEREMAAYNKTLGRFQLVGIPPAPRGIPQIEVTFDIDANGILNVKAVDKATNKEQSITIKGAVSLSDEEVKQAQAEAEKHAAEDQKKKETVEARNMADNLIFTAEKTLKEAGEKVKEEDKKKVEEEINKVKEILKKEDATKEEIEDSTKILSEAIQQVGAAMYQQQQTAAGAQPTAEEPSSAKASEGKEGKAEESSKKEAEEGEVVE